MQEPFIKRHFRKVLLILAGILVVGGGLYFSPARNVLISWRASSLLEDAREFAEAEKWDEVIRLSSASMQLEPSLDGARLLCGAMFNSGNPNLLEMAYFLYRFPGAMPEDRAWVLRLAYDMGDFSNAARLISLLTPAELRDREIHFQVARGFVLTGRVDRAVQLADDPEMAPPDPNLDLLIVQGLAANPSEMARQEVEGRLHRVLTGDHRGAALNAMGIVFFMKEESIGEGLARIAVERFKDDTGLGIAEKLQIDFLRIRLGMIPRNETIESAISRYRRDYLAVLLIWLDRLGEFDRILALSASSDAQAKDRVFRLRLLALEKLGEWDLLQKELNKPPVAIPEPILFALRSLASRQLDDESSARRWWVEAMKAAKADPKTNWFYRLANFARRLGRRDDEMEAVIAGIKHPRGKAPEVELLEPLFLWLQERGESKRLLEVSGRLLKRYRDHPLLINNYRYLKAVLEDVDSKDVEAFQNLVARFPDRKELRSSFAMILLRNGEPEKAIGQLEQISLDPDELPPLARAVRAKALEDLGRRDEAGKLAATIDWTVLKKEEAELLKLSPGP